MIKPRQPAPSLEITLANGTEWQLSEQSPDNFTLIAFYRGLHCPQCAKWIKGLAGLRTEFEKRGVWVIAASSDSVERAERAVDDWSVGSLPVGVMSLDKAREWGLFITSGRGTTSVGIDEPERFNEPGVFLIRPDGTLYSAAIQTMPFARPHWDDMLRAVDFILEKDYPARGDAA